MVRGALGLPDRVPQLASKIHKPLIAFGSPDRVSQLVSEIHKHSFLHRVSLVFIFGGCWFLPADFPNMARSIAIVTTLVLIRAIFSIMVECFVSTTCARFVWSVGFVLLSATESC